jgi:SAM-dependent methyltransferase
MSGLPDKASHRIEGAPDEDSLLQPSLSVPVDPAALECVTSLYRRYFPPGAAILDLMSSWIGHLPPEAEYRRVVGVGLDEQELLENPFLDEWHVQNLNRDPVLPFAAGEFDAAAICVSVQYLTRPIDLLRDVGRVVRPGGPLVITFSNCCLSRKALACWRMLDEDGHLRLVSYYLQAAGNWRDIECRHRCPDMGVEPLYAVIARSAGPFKL